MFTDSFLYRKIIIKTWAQVKSNSLTQLTAERIQ